MPGVNLDAGSYFGVSGLASGSTEPDTIDLYAIDVFEILPVGSVSFSIDVMSIHQLIVIIIRMAWWEV